MAAYVARAVAPNQDKRWELVDATMRRTGQHSRGLIETLHTVQEAFGYLDKSALRYVATSLRVPLSRAYGVATFYHFFTLKPAGEHSCSICTGTACHIRGSSHLLDAAKQIICENRNSQRFSLLTERCIGPCGFGPVVVYDGECRAEQTTDALVKKLEKWDGS